MLIASDVEALYRDDRVQRAAQPVGPQFELPPGSDPRNRQVLAEEPGLSRPARGLGHYLRDVTYGALDGVITTMAVLAGAQGAALSMRVGLILGIANLVGDGISMGASNYLGMRSELEQAGESVAAEAPWRHGLATVAAFIGVGSAPLAAYLAAPLTGVPVFPLAACFSVVALSGAGVARAAFVRKTPLKSSLEMLVVGAVAGGAAFLVGRVASSLAR
jgi:VIT1/CCC1 family predicted Fe2+/Mn2+ transporter